MRHENCWSAINLDGGGSSIMLLEDKDQELRTMNRPSGILGPRPVPVMLGVRRSSIQKVRER
jgi:exopolysaccharide biosynthesis protein